MPETTGTEESPLKAEGAENGDRRAAALREAGALEEGMVVATVADDSASDLAENWARHLLKSRAPHVVACLSDATKKRIQSAGSSAYVADGPRRVSGGPAHATPGWKRFAAARVREMGYLMDRGVSVLMSDADVAFLRSPVPYLRCAEEDCQGSELKGARIAASSDNLGPDRDAARGATYAAGGVFNTGIVLLTKTRQGREWQRNWLANLEQPSHQFDRFTSDQQARIQAKKGALMVH